MGGLGEMDCIENPTVKTVMEVICSVLDDVLYKRSVSVNWSPERTVTVPAWNLDGPNQPYAPPPG